MEQAKPRINRALLDRYLLVHFGIGFVMRLAGLPAGGAFAAAVAWEAVENRLKAALPGAFPRATPDTLRNALGDIAAELAGFAAARWLLPPGPSRRADGDWRG